MFFAVASAFEPGRWVTSSATADFRSRKLLVEYDNAPSSTRAMSRSRTVRPSAPALTTMSSNCFWSFRRPVKGRLGWNARSAIGGSPICPPLIRRLCARLRAATLHARRPKPQGRERVGSEPQPHRIIAGAEHLDVADTIEAKQVVAHLQERIV